MTSSQLHRFYIAPEPANFSKLSIVRYAIDDARPVSTTYPVQQQFTQSLEWNGNPSCGIYFGFVLVAEKFDYTPFSLFNIGPGSDPSVELWARSWIKFDAGHYSSSSSSSSSLSSGPAYYDELIARLARHKVHSESILKCIHSRFGILSRYLWSSFIAGNLKSSSDG